LSTYPLSLTRRSSDLTFHRSFQTGSFGADYAAARNDTSRTKWNSPLQFGLPVNGECSGQSRQILVQNLEPQVVAAWDAEAGVARSEEHTSELQSRENL